MNTEDADFFVTLDDLHSMPGTGTRQGWCRKGARELCARYGLNWAQIVRAEGINAQALLDTGDALAAQLVEHARAGRVE